MIGKIAMTYRVVYFFYLFIFFVCPPAPWWKAAGLCTFILNASCVSFQDYMGEAPIHKAARAGSMDCINALLFSGAKPE